jgi:DNA (cytosine-5)-methyltransferase 1
MFKIKKPSEFKNVEQRFNSHTLNEILPYLPNEDCFFDTRHWTCDTTDGILPFAVTTGISRNAQQFLKEMKEVLPLNADEQGLCRPLKAQYYKNGRANFLKSDGGSFAATGVIERDTPMKGNYTEPKICTMVGRDPNNPSSRARSDHYEQFLEMGDDVSNTLTSVQKDNLVAEPLRIPQATKQGYIEVPQGAVFDMSYPESTTRRGRGQEGGQVSPTLMAGGEAPCHYEGKESTSYRIRKLTPRECFRLMGVTETDIDKIQQSGVSQSQQYKMAGNSIVVDCLYHLFRKMFTETENENQQLSLF